MNEVLDAFLDSVRLATREKWSLPDPLLDVWWARGQPERVITWARAHASQRGALLARYASLDVDAARSAQLALEAISSPRLRDVLEVIPVSDPQVLRVATEASRRAWRRQELSWSRVRNPALIFPSLEELRAAAPAQAELVAWAATRLEGDARAEFLELAWANVTGFTSVPGLLAATRACGDWRFVTNDARPQALRWAALSGPREALETLLGHEPSALDLATVAVALREPPAAWGSTLEDASTRAEDEAMEGLLTIGESQLLTWGWAAMRGEPALEELTGTTLGEAWESTRAWVDDELGQDVTAAQARPSTRDRVMKSVNEVLAGKARPFTALHRLARVGRQGYFDLVREGVELLEAQLGPLDSSALEVLSFCPGRSLECAQGDLELESAESIACLARGLWRDGHPEEARAMAARTIVAARGALDVDTITRLAPLMFSLEPSSRDRARALAHDALAQLPGSQQPVRLEGARRASFVELEQRLAGRFEREAALVLADQLQSAGDPRGELIMLHDAGKVAEANALIARHAELFLGPLAAWGRSLDGDRRPTFEWELGFIRRARLGYVADLAGTISSQAGTLEEGLEALLRHPSGSMLAELILSTNYVDNGMRFGPLVEVLARVGAPRLRALRLGAYSFHGARELGDGDFEYEISWVELPALAPLRALPSLEELTLQGQLAGEELVGLPPLRSLTIISGGLSAANVRAVAASQGAELETLELWLGSSEYGASATLDDLAAILEGARFPKLRVLRLMNAEFADELALALTRAPVLAQLTELGLGYGTLSDEGAAHLVAHATAFTTWRASI